MPARHEGGDSAPPLCRIGAALEEKQFHYFLAGSFLSNIGSWMQSSVINTGSSPFFVGRIP